MKKRILLLAMILLLQALPSYAQINNAGFEGGIHKDEQDYKKEKQYKEVIFVTGNPVVMYGKVKISIKDKKLTYDYVNMKSKDGSVTMKKHIEIDRIIESAEDIKQVVEENNIIKYKEEISDSIGNTYTLEDYQFHNSTIDDNQPIVNYYSGNWLGTKVYKVNDGEKKLSIDITGNIYGYDHFWGATETQKIKQYITQTDVIDDEIDWTGSSEINISFNRTKNMEYFDNLPYQTSFSGGYTLTEKKETVMVYDYDMPYFDKDGEIADVRNRGTATERFDTLPTQKKLYIPKFEDIKGIWSEWDIKRLAGLGVFDSSKKFFGPKLPTERAEFARWLSKAMQLVDKEDKPKRSFTKEEVNPPVFADVTNKNLDYEYIKAIKERGIMTGVGNGTFMPKGKLTRAQAVTIVIRSIGLERLAPNPPFTTPFKDDKDIPLWAKKSIYVANQINLARGNAGYIHPNDYMTREEAAAFINRFINYLQTELKKEYRDNIINYGL
ncbi:S-layer homology domain-containing protein [Abyssisolibacter fermentans]|uniref:S-layer homology domain-containing protein n=1 Tax=Abyssisolibacter fermentans TaxID=1766203 RepID=UPI000831F45B|nr:S-layer homology domain-containing protein [Abyssisolibacter fermentans]